jgi:hypothetical protein
MIVDVVCDDGTVQIAQTIAEDEYSYSVLFLKKKKDFYNFDDEIVIVPKESISGFYDVDRLEDTELYMMTSNGYELIDDSEDEDFEYSETDESESESLIEEDEA